MEAPWIENEKDFKAIEREAASHVGCALDLAHTRHSGRANPDQLTLEDRVAVLEITLKKVVEQREKEKEILESILKKIEDIQGELTYTRQIGGLV